MYKAFRIKKGGLVAVLHVTREAIREIDRVAIQEYGLPGVVLMENAGHGAARIAFQMLGDKKQARTSIVCGSGNNAGDGFVIARHLHNRGIAVEVRLLAPPEKIAGDALINLKVIQKMGLDIQQASPGELTFDGSDLIVDAMLGTGLQGDVREPYFSAIRAVNAAKKPVLCVDIPSGLDADTGRILGQCVYATRTATFAAPKVGFTRNHGPEMAAYVDVIDIGIPRGLLDRQ
jgi:hydroxyethylthiazole kinase-like uncharacterized protein yjeF